jgi:hypothetical protein
VKWFNTEVCKTSIHRFESGRRLQHVSRKPAQTGRFLRCREVIPIRGRYRRVIPGSRSSTPIQKNRPVAMVNTVGGVLTQIASTIAIPMLPNRQASPAMRCCRGVRFTTPDYRPMEQGGVGCGGLDEHDADRGAGEQRNASHQDQDAVIWGHGPSVTGIASGSGYRGVCVPPHFVRREVRRMADGGWLAPQGFALRRRRRGSIEVGLVGELDVKGGVVRL